jgi:hypothetical protein
MAIGMAKKSKEFSSGRREHISGSHLFSYPYISSIHPLFHTHEHRQFSRATTIASHRAYAFAPTRSLQRSKTHRSHLRILLPSLLSSAAYKSNSHRHQRYTNMDSSLPVQTPSVSNGAAELTYASWTQVTEVRPGHWPDLYIPDDCIPQDLRQYYAIGAKLEYPGYVAGHRPIIDWIRYNKFTRERKEAASRRTTSTGMPYRFNKVNGRIELDLESGGPVRSQVNGPVTPAAAQL